MSITLYPESFWSSEQSSRKLYMYVSKMAPTYNTIHLYACICACMCVKCLYVHVRTYELKNEICSKIFQKTQMQ